MFFSLKLLYIFIKIFVSLLQIYEYSRNYKVDGYFSSRITFYMHNIIRLTIKPVLHQIHCCLLLYQECTFKIKIAKFNIKKQSKYTYIQKHKFQVNTLHWIILLHINAVPSNQKSKHSLTVLNIPAQQKWKDCFYWERYLTNVSFFPFNKSSNTSNKWITTVIFLTWYRNFFVVNGWLNLYWF